MASKPAAGRPSEVGGDRHRKSNSGKVALQGNDLPKPGVTPQHSLLFSRHGHFPLERDVIHVTLSFIAVLMINLRAIKKYS
ncbi:MAG: hypothetical protein VW619_06230 [Rhodobiaceae bacterium]|jgi:hypothetical protein